jgi:RNA polymerase sigma-70 factor (ECF subfamily)
MEESKPPEITQLLHDWANGDQAALDRLTPRVYRELRQMAGQLMKYEAPGRTMQPTALVHEAYLRLIDVDKADWQDRAHFFAVASQMMRRILVDAARKRSAAKRGGQAVRVELDEIPDFGTERSSELIALDDALERLAEMDPRKARVIELRFFGGLSVAEVAGVLQVSEDTVVRDFRLARAWLKTEMERG